MVNTLSYMDPPMPLTSVVFIKRKVGNLARNVRALKNTFYEERHTNKICIFSSREGIVLLRSIEKCAATIDVNIKN